MQEVQTRVVDEKWCVAGLVIPEVNNNLLGFVHIQDLVVVVCTPAYQLLHLLSTGQVIVTPNEANHSYVIRKLHNMVGGHLGDAIMCHQGE